MRRLFSKIESHALTTWFLRGVRGFLETVAFVVGGQKKHINFFNINFLDPTQNTSFWAQRKVYMPHFLGKDEKEGPHKLFRENFWAQTGHFGPQKVEFIVFSLPLVCDPSIPPEEFLGLSGPKLETELKMSSRGLAAPVSKKLKTESKKSRKS